MSSQLELLSPFDENDPYISFDIDEMLVYDIKLILKTNYAKKLKGKVLHIQNYDEEAKKYYNLSDARTVYSYQLYLRIAVEKEPVPGFLSVEEVSGLKRSISTQVSYKDLGLKPPINGYLDDEEDEDESIESFNGSLLKKSDFIVKDFAKKIPLLNAIIFCEDSGNACSKYERINEFSDGFWNKVKRRVKDDVYFRDLSMRQCAKIFFEMFKKYLSLIRNLKHKTCDDISAMFPYFHNFHTEIKLSRFAENIERKLDAFELFKSGTPNKKPSFGRNGIRKKRKVINYSEFADCDNDNEDEDEDWAAMKGSEVRKYRRHPIVKNEDKDSESVYDISYTSEQDIQAKEFHTEKKTKPRRRKNNEDDDPDFVDDRLAVIGPVSVGKDESKGDGPVPVSTDKERKDPAPKNEIIISPSTSGEKRKIENKRGEEEGNIKVKRPYIRTGKWIGRYDSAKYKARQDAKKLSKTQGNTETENQAGPENINVVEPKRPIKNKITMSKQRPSSANSDKKYFEERQRRMADRDYQTHKKTPKEPSRENDVLMDLPDGRIIRRDEFTVDIKKYEHIFYALIMSINRISISTFSTTSPQLDQFWEWNWNKFRNEPRNQKVRENYTKELLKEECKKILQQYFKILEHLAHYSKERAQKLWPYFERFHVLDLTLFREDINYLRERFNKKKVVSK